MATPTNLYQYYTGLGKTLPSLQERSKLYESYGLGQAGTYTGEIGQNNALLNKLIGQSNVTTPPVNTSWYNPPAGSSWYNPQGGGTSVGTQAPIYTPTPTGQIQLPPIQTDLGQTVIKERQRVGMPIDEQAIRKSYRDYGLENKYGSWTGSAEQWKALGIEDVNYSFQQLQQKALKEGIQNSQGETIVPPADSATMVDEAAKPTYEYSQMSGDDVNKVMDDIVSKIGTTDLAKLIQDFSGGDITTPELELDEESRDAALNDLKASAAQGLSKLQQGLAAKGMTFSGIRTEAEASLAADTLSKESGINREFAGKIINAARQEQTRRETALKAAETNYNKALEAQGYVYNPFTNTIEKTLQREQFEQKSTAKTFSSGGGYYSYDPETGQVTELVSPAQKAPQTMTTSQGIMEWNPDTGQWEATGFYAKSGSEGTQAEKEQSNIQNFRSRLNAVSGDDGHISEGDWQKYKKQWLDKGLSEDDFVKNFIDKINPDFADSYGAKELEYSQEYTFSTDLQLAIADATSKKAAKLAMANLTKAYPTKANIIQAAFENLNLGI